MNEFTKEELQELSASVYHHVGFKKASMQDDLLSKIKSLIDNYCEHEWIKCHHNMFFCEKCGVHK